MDTSQQIVLDYLLSSEQGEILKRNGEELKKLKIGDKTYNFEGNKHTTDRLKRKFNKIRHTIDYKRYELKEKTGIRWINLDKTKHSQEYKRDTKQPSPTNNLPSRTIHHLMPSATSRSKASRQYNT